MAYPIYFVSFTCTRMFIFMKKNKVPSFSETAARSKPISDKSIKIFKTTLFISFLCDIVVNQLLLFRIQNTFSIDKDFTF